MRPSLLALLALAMLLPAAAAGPARPIGDGRPEVRMRVELTTQLAMPLALSFVEQAGGVVEVHSGGRLQARVTERTLATLRAASGVVRVERPALFVLLELGPAAELIGAGRWQTAGLTGRGTRVAIIDAGFSGYEETFAAELGRTVFPRSFRFDRSVSGSTDHGQRAAAIVREMAPGAELYLLSFSTLTELSAAVDYAIAEQIDAVSLSVGFIHNGPGDGSGAVDDIVGRAADAGMVWAVAAGNWAEQHWTGVFVDSDGDLVHEFAPGRQLNGREFRSGDLITASLRWDDAWGAACSDYDLELFGPDGSLVQASRHAQGCSGDPVEEVRVLATMSGRYAVRLLAAGEQEPRRLDLLLLGSPDRGDALDVLVRERSLSEPADHPDVVTVGALSSGGDFAQATFSSRGPTADGRSKPELISPTGLAAALGETGEPLTQFTGTSAAAPFVAGAAALLMEAFPEADAADVVATLRARALPVPEPGPAGGDDPAGLVQLGSLSGIGPVLPAEADRAVLFGTTPEMDGLGAFAYRGPDAYPLRFAHLLVDHPLPVAYFRYDQATKRWDRHIVGAPRRVNTFDRLNDGDAIVVLFRAPPTR